MTTTNTTTNFTQLGLHPSLLKAVTEQGYTIPTPVQAQAIPIVMAGKDLMAGAQTGTGKTAAFTLPLLHWLNLNPAKEHHKKPVRILILTPTRELAAQVAESVRSYGKHLAIKSAVIFGGVGQGTQVSAIQRGVDVLIATPGRLLDLHSQRLIDLSRVEKLVLDEADRMLDMGFIVDVKKILAFLPKQKQSLLFSATFDDGVVDLARSLLIKPEHIQVTPKNTTVERISQIVYTVGRKHKTALLSHLIAMRKWTQVLVFTRTKHTANQVAETLEAQGINAMAFHGNKSQTLRTRAMRDFKSGKIRAMIATDIMARGIDIDSLPHVVNFDIPNNSEDYVHRIGRTGRAGSAGEAISFVSLDEQGFMADIEKFIRQKVAKGEMDGELAQFAPHPNETAEPIAMGRQTIWGGLGKMPGRSVMKKANNRARSEMNERNFNRKSSGGRDNRDFRENKDITQNGFRERNRESSSENRSIRDDKLVKNPLQNRNFNSAKKPHISPKANTSNQHKSAPGNNPNQRTAKYIKSSKTDDFKKSTRNQSSKTSNSASTSETKSKFSVREKIQRYFTNPSKRP